jgi:hypothetical protein
MILLQRDKNITDPSSTAFSLNAHLLSPERGAGPHTTSRASLSLQSSARMIVQSTQFSLTGIPIDWDRVAFWAHGLCARAALVAVKYNMLGVENLKTYLRFFEPRYKLYGKEPLAFVRLS